MTTWTLEKAKNQFSELVRNALGGTPQFVMRGGREEETVVIISRAEYERLLAPMNLVDFLEQSPLADAFAAGDFGPDDPFDRPREFGRELSFVADARRERKKKPRP